MRNELPLIPGPGAGVQSTFSDLVCLAEAGCWLLCVDIVAVVTAAHIRALAH